MTKNSTTLSVYLFVIVGVFAFSAHAFSQATSTTIIGPGSGNCTGTFTYQVQPSGGGGNLQAQWSIKDPSGSTTLITQNANSVTIAFPTAGSYTLYATNIGGSGGPYYNTQKTISVGTSLSAPGPITVVSNTNVVSGIHLCRGTTATVDIAPVTNADSYRWEAPNGWRFPNNLSSYSTTSTSPVTIIPPFGSGSATIKVQAIDDASGCGSAYRTVVVSYGSVLPEIDGPETVRANEGRSYSILGTGIESGTIDWHEPTGWSLVGSNGNTTALMNTGNSLPGDYTVEVDYRSCGLDRTATLDVELISSGGGGGGGIIIDPGFGRPTLDSDLDVAELTMYPNPASESVTLQSPISLASIRVLSLTGKEVSSVAPQGTKTTFSVNALSEGLYLIETIDVEGNTQVSRLLVR